MKISLLENCKALCRLSVLPLSLLLSLPSFLPSYLLSTQDSTQPSGLQQKQPARLGALRELLFQCSANKSFCNDGNVLYLHFLMGWLWSLRQEASTTEKLSFKFYFHFLHLNLNGHMRLVAMPYETAVFQRINQTINKYISRHKIFLGLDGGNLKKQQQQNADWGWLWEGWALLILVGQEKPLSAWQRATSHRKMWGRGL